MAITRPALEKRLKVIACAAVAVAIAALLCFALAAPRANASLRHLLIGEFGSVENPQFQAADGLAVDGSNGDLLVIDAEAKTVSRYHADGTPAPFSGLGTNVIDAKGGGECPTVSSDCDQTPQNGFAFGEFAGEAQITVDNSGTATDGNIYVTQGLAGSPVHVVDIFAGSGAYLGQLTAAGDVPFTEEEDALTPCGVAVDEAGSLYVAAAENNRIFKYSPSANPPVNSDLVASFVSVSQPCSIAAGVGPTTGSLFANVFFSDQENSLLKVSSSSGALDYVVDPKEDRLVSVDPASGNVFALGRDDSDVFKVVEEVREFDASGSAPVLLSTTPVTAPAKGLATYSGRLYVSRGERVYEYGPAVVVPDVETGEATITSNTSATIHGTVNPDGVAVTECRVEYGTTKTYGSSAPCAESPGEVGAGTDPVSVHADIASLTVETLYHYRVVATNENDTTVGEDRTFRTPTKPEIRELQSSAVTENSARIETKLNPGNSLTSVHFEWGLTEAYGQATPTTTTDSETGEPLQDDGGHRVWADLSELDPGTTYHWRVVASNALGTVAGPDRTFTTHLSASAGLPDARVYEIVSPARKGSADFAIPTQAGGVADKSVKPVQASPTGGWVTFPSFTAVGSGAGGAPAASQYLSDLDGGGWDTQNITPLFEEGGLRDPLVGFSEDLSHAALIVPEPALTADASKSFTNLYVRDNLTGVITAATPEPPTPVIGIPKGDYCLSYGGASADFSRVFFSARGALRPGDPVGTGFNLYEWSSESGLELISRLPGASGTPATPRVGTGFGTMSGNGFCVPTQQLMRNAVSADGSRVFWTYEGTAQGAKDPLLARITGEGGGETVRLDAPAPGGTAPGGEGQFWDASANGERVFFTTDKPLTADSTATPDHPELYLYDFGFPPGSRLTNLTAGGVEPADVSGVMGVSADGSFVYFVARGVLTEVPNSEGTVALPGAFNVYVWQDGSTRFIGAVSQQIASSLGNPATQTARPTPDGKHLAFTSPLSLTGFENGVLGGGGCQLRSFGEDELVESPACEEVFLYDYESDSLTCASCSPTNASPIGPSRVPSWSTPYEQPRYLSDDGERLLFDTLDSLLPQDINGKRDVYEFERSGAGSCTADTPTFSLASGGCIYLLSSGESSDESYLLDASADGDHVFISTRERLVPTDEDEQYDVYDVRVNGILPPPPPPICSGELCRAPGIAPPLSAPSSSQLQGPGNSPPPPKRCRKGMRKVVRNGKVRCVKKKGQKRKHSHRRADSSRSTARAGR